MADLASAIKQAGDSGGLTMRTGRVVYLDAARISVQIAGGDAVDMASPRGNAIVLGDYVQVLGQGGVWWCLGAADGIPQDSVLGNGSFETDPVGTTPPTSWTVYHDPARAASSTVSVRSATNYAVHGANVLSIVDGAAGGSGTYVSSEAIPVQPGQIWTAAASFAGYISGTANGSTAQLALTMHTNAATTYPTYVGPLGVVDASGMPLGGGIGWRLLRQHSQASGLSIPGGLAVTHMRIMLYTSIAGPGNVDWDCVIARRIDV